VADPEDIDGVGPDLEEDTVGTAAFAVMELSDLVAYVPHAFAGKSTTVGMFHQGTDGIQILSSYCWRTENYHPSDPEKFVR
jgi:hypothetical protein